MPKRTGPSDLVFKNRKGEKIKEISNAFSRTVNELGFNDDIEDKRYKVCFHTLRHTFASWLVEGGTDLYAVQKPMGHSTISMTERYAHLSNGTLQNGNTNPEMRQRLMLTFNTPFYPEILIASMIMAEGVDLHLNCRHVIHHDLCWNPSTLEQRTGRIDRIGAKVERCKQPIQVYFPYISQTQDEKMYRVVMDRERWFKVVMGEKYKVDSRTTEKLAERIPFPEEAASSLSFDLSVFVNK